MSFFKVIFQYIGELILIEIYGNQLYDVNEIIIKIIIIESMNICKDYIHKDTHLIRLEQICINSVIS
jgi:hypothetical protein